MKQRTIILFFVLLCAGLVGFGQDKKEKPKEVTISGAITDVKCYLNGMAMSMGEDHKQCSIDCITGGLPVGILEDKTNKLYVVVPASHAKATYREI